MKLRSALLLACMLVVPALAMFSHRVPADVRAAMRGGIERLVALWKSPPPATAAVVAGGDSSATPPAPVAPVVPVTDRPIVVGAGVAPVAAGPSAPAPPAVAPPMTIPAAALTAAAGDVEAGLRAAGASGIECRPVEGTPGLHVASCRVGLDASGQLVRVFHASGRDAESAARSLLDDVLAWKQRVASREPAGGGDGAAAPERRF